jgi:hypothetical protein
MLLTWQATAQTCQWTFGDKTFNFENLGYVEVAAAPIGWSLSLSPCDRMYYACLL